MVVVVSKGQMSGRVLSVAVVVVVVAGKTSCMVRVVVKVMVKRMMICIQMILDLGFSI